MPFLFDIADFRHDDAMLLITPLILFSCLRRLFAISYHDYAIDAYRFPRDILLRYITPLLPPAFELYADASSAFALIRRCRH